MTVSLRKGQWNDDLEFLLGACCFKLKFLTNQQTCRFCGDCNFNNTRLFRVLSFWSYPTLSGAAIEQIGNGRVNYIIGYVARDHDAVDVSLDHRGKEHDKINASVHFRSDKNQERYLKTQIVACRYVTSLHMVIVTG